MNISGGTAEYCYMTQMNISGNVMQHYDITQMSPVNLSGLVISNVYYYRPDPGYNITGHGTFLGYYRYDNPVFYVPTTPPSIEFEVPKYWQFFTKTD